MRTIPPVGGAIKARFTMATRRAGFTPPPRLPIVKSDWPAGVNLGLPALKGEVALQKKGLIGKPLQGANIAKTLSSWQILAKSF
jgi:hypothetical protein